MEADGTLAEIINQTIFDELNSEIDDAQSRISGLETSVYTEHVNVRGVGYGAVGDGVTDDTQAIQNALDLAITNGSTSVYVPRGKYKWTDAIIIHENTTLILDENAEILRYHDTAMLVNGPNGTSNYTGYNGPGNILVQGGIWNARGGAQGGAPAVLIAHAHDITFRGCTFKDVKGGHSIEINSSKNIKVEDCNCLGFYEGPAGREFSEAIQLDVNTESAFGSYTIGSYDHTPCRNITISRCYFGASENAGPYGKAIGGHQHEFTDGSWHEYLKVSECTIEGATDWGIRVYNTNHVVIENNTFIDSAGVEVKPLWPAASSVGTSQYLRDVAITNNVFDGIPTTQAILLAGEPTGTIFDVSIMGNLIYNVGPNQAIRGVYATHVSVQGNVMNAIGGTPISFSDVSNLSVKDNVMNNANENGISVGSSTTSVSDVSIIGNQMRNIQKTGILAFSSVDKGVIMNNILSDIALDTSNPQHGIEINDWDIVIVSGNIITGTTHDWALKIGAGTQNIMYYGNTAAMGTAGYYLDDGPSSVTTPNNIKL
jgi:polygalacturonase